MDGLILGARRLPERLQAHNLRVLYAVEPGWTLPLTFYTPASNLTVLPSSAFVSALL